MRGHNPFTDLSCEDIQALIAELSGVPELELDGLRYMAHDTDNGPCYICKSAGVGHETVEGIGDTLLEATAHAIKQITQIHITNE
jgi:hypothetical protein